jgi:hypothetical protein
VVLGALGCGDARPHALQVYGLAARPRQYGFYEVPLDHLDDAAQMRGRAVAFRGGATLVQDVLVDVATPADEERAFRVEGGGPVACAFTEADGVLVADDYDSLAIASSYAALEQARDMYEGLGLAPGELNTLRAYYNPDFQAGTTLVPTFFELTDNAAYVPLFDAFLIVPHLALDPLPFYVNAGVMAHEYGHKVHNHLVEHDSRFGHADLDGWSGPATRQLRGVDEGLADVFGGLRTGDPDYIGASLSRYPALGVDRDMTQVRVMTDTDVALALDGAADGRDFDPHELGAFVAATLWQLGAELDAHDRVGRAILQTERALGDELAAAPAPFDYSVLGFWSRLAAQLPVPDERARLCQLVQQRFGRLIARDRAHPLTGCAP